MVSAMHPAVGWYVELLSTQWMQFSKGPAMRSHLFTAVLLVCYFD
eukprot:COSAG01_NODE_77909_length_155_cov_79.785714_1_plen_44_part_01